MGNIGVPSSKIGMATVLLLATGWLAVVNAWFSIPVKKTTSPFSRLSSTIIDVNEGRRSLTTFHIFEEACRDQGLDSNQMVEKLVTCGWKSDMELLSFASDFLDRPEVLANILKDDFGFSVLEAHKCRAALTNLLRRKSQSGVVSIDGASESILLGSVVSAPNLSQLETATSLSASAVPSLSAPTGSTSTAAFACTSTSTSMSMSATDNTATVTPKLNLPLSNATVASAIGSGPNVYRGKFKDTVVNPKQSERREQALGGLDYGLPADLGDKCPILAAELDAFYRFMTEPHPLSQDSPIRKSTADVYLRHARLFLGWNLATGGFGSDPSEVLQASLTVPFPTKEREGVTSVFDFMQFLRKTRKVSISYEANMLRGLIKLAKFRFARESSTDTSYGGKSFEDIPLIREARKLHREANRRQSTAPRVSDEKLKWLSWPEYLGVVQAVRHDLVKAMDKYTAMYGPESGYEERLEARVRTQRVIGGKRGSVKGRRSVRAPLDLDWKRKVRGGGADERGHRVSVRGCERAIRPFIEDAMEASEARTELGERKQVSIKPQAAPKDAARRNVARLFQHYLVVALLACIPDRQRTFRELEIGKTLVKEEGQWLIKHGPDDYKTGKSYGTRPPLVVASELAPLIDLFIDDFRPALNPDGSHLFTQRGSGKPFTADSMYQVVARLCFNHTGKKTNPHLLRDMIVTHVRETDASEKELEALALYMGHSINMQRSSYDRRTLNQKVAPAVDLLNSINKIDETRVHR